LQIKGFQGLAFCHSILILRNICGILSDLLLPKIHGAIHPIPLMLRCFMGQAMFAVRIISNGSS
jgi:hypothetical protein